MAGQNQTRSRAMGREIVHLLLVSWLYERWWNAYRRMGHGAQLTSAYTSRMFILAAVMYVDDTDLLHWAPSPTTPSRELVQQVTEATNDWGLLGQATDGALKPGKCFLYLLNYSFNNG